MASLSAAGLEQELAGVTQGFRGRIGVCIQRSAGSEPECLRGKERFSLQSVMKLIVSAVVLEQVDAGKERLDNVVVVRREDANMFEWPMLKMVGKDGYRATVGELIERAVTESDSMAVDILLRRMGGTANGLKAVNSFLSRHGVSGIRLDRDERQLQTEIIGIPWKKEYEDIDAQKKAIAAVPKEKRTAAYKKYQADVRDTATPEGMNQFLRKLVEGQLISAKGTEYLLGVMKRTATGADRLKAGTAAGWTLGHKTGTAGTWNGVSAAINDVGVLWGPNGERVTVVAFVGDTEEPAAKSAAAIAKVAAVATMK